MIQFSVEPVFLRFLLTNLAGLYGSFYIWILFQIDHPRKKIYSCNLSGLKE